jgi:hypothetical protein
MHALPTLEPQTLGGMLAEGLRLGPVNAPSHQRTATLESLRVWLDDDGVHTALTVIVEAASKLANTLSTRKVFPHGRWPAALDLPSDAEGQSRAQEVLARWVGEPDPLDAEELMDRLLDALIPPPPPSSLFAWVVDNGLELLNGSDGVIARVVTGSVSLVLKADQLVVDRSHRRFGGVRVFVTLERSERSLLTDRIEQEVYYGAMGVRADSLAAPDVLSAPLAGWIEAWRTGVTQRLRRGLAEYDGLPMPSQALEGRSIFHLFQFWLEEGPAPKRPPPRLRIDPATVDRCLDRVHEVPLPKVRARLRGRAFPTIQSALELEGWTVVFAAGTSGAQLGDARILLVKQGSQPVTMLRSDDEIQNRLKYTLDGDAATMRQVLQFFATVLTRKGIDRELKVRYAEDTQVTSVAKWLGFRAHIRFAARL